MGFAQANLAFVLGLRGETAAAFAYSGAAEQRIREQDGRLGELLVDRADLLLSVRLVGEAREAAEQAVAEYARGRRDMKLPQARLVLAEAALLDGDAAAALPHARRAAREFARQHRPEWAALARLLVLRATCPDGCARAADVRAALEVTRTLTAARWPSSALDARILTATLLRRRGQHAEAAAHLREAARTRTAGPAMLRARGWYAEALARDDAGNPRGARAAIRAGLRLLDEHRAVLGAIDVRAHAAGHRTALAELGLRIALRSGRPRGRAGVGRARPGDRAAHAALGPPAGRPGDRGGARRPARDRPGDQRAARRRPGRGGRAAAGPADGPGAANPGAVAAPRRTARTPWRRPPPSTNWPRRSATPALLELVDADGTLIAITLAAGRVRLHRIGPMRGADGLLDRVAFAVSRLLRPDLPAAVHDAAAALLRDSAARADDALLRRMPELAGRPLVVVPTGSLQNVPWALLPSCAGRPVTVSPSATLWLGARSRPADPGHALVAAGPALPGADAEARAVAAVHGVDPAAGRRRRRPSGCCGRSTAPASSTWPRTAASLRTTRCSPSSRWPTGRCSPTTSSSSPPPRTPSCWPRARAGGRWCARATSCSGLGAMFLARGSSQLVASPLPVPDTETAPLMTAFHRRVAAGRPVAQALAEAQEQMRGTGVAELTTGCFVCVGSGFGRAPLLPAPRRASDPPPVRTPDGPAPSQRRSPPRLHRPPPR